MRVRFEVADEAGHSIFGRSSKTSRWKARLLNDEQDHHRHRPGSRRRHRLLLVAASPELALLGVTTVAGNVPLPLTTRNARTVLELAGRRDVPSAGAAAPLDVPLVTAEHVHGKTGLDGIELPEPSLPPSTRAMRPTSSCTLREHAPGNIALPAGADQHRPRAAPCLDIAARIQRIVLMGGGFFEGGNIWPVTEFNFYVDPQAAHEVFSEVACLSSWPHWTATHRVLTTRARREARALGICVGTTVAAWMDFTAL